MHDLISRQDVIKAVLLSNFSACTVYGRSEEGMATAKGLIQAIKNLPSAQPERKKGKWEHEVDTGCDMLACSVCGCRAIEREYKIALGTSGMAFCPYCGADMRGGDDVGDTE